MAASTVASFGNVVSGPTSLQQSQQSQTSYQMSTAVATETKMFSVGESMLEDIICDLPEFRTKSNQAVIIPFARQVSLFFTLCQQKSSLGQHQTSSPSGGLSSNNNNAAIAQFISSGAATIVGNQMLTSVENMCQIVMTLEKSNNAAPNRLDRQSDKNSPKPTREELCEATLRSAQMMYHVLDSAKSSVDTTDSVAVENLLKTVAQESRNVLSNLCHLLNAADNLKVDGILRTHDKVLSVLRHMETVTNFQEFVQCFGEFGTNMVELAQTSGERQNELLNEACSFKLSCTRSILEKGTMMLLTCSKTLLRHPECNSAQRTRDSVYEMLKSSLTQLRKSVDGTTIAGGGPSGAMDRMQSPGPVSIQQMMIEIQGLLTDCLLTETLSQWTLNKLLSLVDCIKNEFNLLLAGESSRLGGNTNSPPGTSNLQQETTGLMSIPAEEVSHITTALDQLQITCQTFTPQLLLSASTGKENTSPIDSFTSNFWLHFSDLTKSLHSTVLNQCAHCLTTQNEMLHSLQLFQQAARGNLSTTAPAGGQDSMNKSGADTTFPSSGSNLKSGAKQGLMSTGSNNSIHAVEAEALKFQQLYADQYQNLCRLLYHVCESTRLRVMSEHCRSCIKYFSHQLILSAQTAALYPSSKIANENLAVFTDTWNNQMQEFSTLMKDISDVITGKADGPPQMTAAIGTDILGMKSGYATAAEARLAKLGLNVKRVSSYLENEVDMLHSSLDAEGVLTSTQLSPDKSTCSDIMKRCRNLCSMAFALYLFTRKSGPLNTASDVLTQVQFFAQESLKIHSLVNENSQQLLSLANGGQIRSMVPMGAGQPVDSVTELKTLLTEIPGHIKQLLIICEGSSIGRNSTNRVEISFEEVNLVLWHLLSLIRYYFQAIYLTYLPDYSLNMTVGATVAPAMFQQYPIQGQIQQPGSMLPQQQLPFNQQGFHQNFVMQSVGSGAAAVSNSSPIMHSTLQQTQQHNSPQFRSQMMGGPGHGNQIPGVGGGGGSNSTSPPHSFSSSPNQQNNQLIAPISGAINPNFISLASNGNLKKTSSLFDRM